MGSHKQRETRQVIYLNARLRSDGGWTNITICNVSSRGLMGRCNNPPAKGAFVEIRRGASCVVGHVRWSQGIRFGLRSQDRICVAALLDERPEKVSGIERRAAERAADQARAKASPAQRNERSRQLASLLEWCAISATAMAGAGLLMIEVKDVLSRPHEQTRQALDVSNRR
jgi:hypothetical protein